MKINKFHSPYLLIFLSSFIQCSAPQPQPGTQAKPASPEGAQSATHTQNPANASASHVSASAVKQEQTASLHASMGAVVHSAAAAGGKHGSQSPILGSQPHPFAPVTQSAGENATAGTAGSTILAAINAKTVAGAASANPEQPPSILRRASAPPVPQLSLQALASGAAAGQLYSPPAQFSLDSTQQPPITIHHVSYSRRPSLSGAASATANGGAGNPHASPSLKPLTVTSPPGGSQHVQVVYAHSAPHRRASVSGASASPNLRPMAAPVQRSASPRELIEASQTRMAHYAAKLASELAGLKYQLELATQSREAPLSPRHAAVVRRDIEIYEAFAPAAEYLMIPTAAKKIALAPHTANATGKPAATDTAAGAAKK